MKRIGIVGHFGGDKVFLDGQTVKTKNVYRALCESFSVDDIYKLDTYGYKRNLFPFVFRVFKLIASCKNVVMLPDENGVKVFIPLYVTINFLLKRKLHYIVVGGWLPNFLKKRKTLTKLAKRLTGVYVETSSMKTDLEEMGFNNVYLLPNFKYIDAVSDTELEYDTTLPHRLCIFSRIMEQKGVEDAISAINEINDERGEVVYSLDLYGPVDDGYKERFDELRAGFPEHIRYMGCVDSSKSVETVKKYFALLFPTRFYTEGVPGTLIDACAAGVPVITSLWVNYKDVFIEGVTGWGYEFGDTYGFKSLLVKAADNSDDFLKMKTSALEAFKKYSPEKSIEVLIQRIF